MKVYSHYYKLENEEGLRWRTLLQFGESWEVIGSVVMKNPGSAVPKYPVSEQAVAEKLSAFDNSKDTWYEFTDDDTMRKVSVLFASYYGMDYVSQLSGVVQIFNLFYIMDPDEQQAEIKLKHAGLPTGFHDNDDLLNYDLEHLIAPVYLGFGDLAFKDSFRDSARKYFDRLFKAGFPARYLKENYEENTFYHPQYLCGHGSSKPQSIFIRRHFREKPISENDAVSLPKLKMPQKQLLVMVQQIREGYHEQGFVTYHDNPKDLKTIRLVLPLDLQITITATGNGYVGVRHVDELRQSNYCKDAYEHKDVIDTLFLTKLKFNRNDGTKMWLAVKELDTFTNVQSIWTCIRNLYDELLSLEQKLT